MSSRAAAYLNSPPRAQLKPDNVLRLLKHYLPPSSGRSRRGEAEEEEKAEEEHETPLLQHLEWEPAALIHIWKGYCCTCVRERTEPLP